MHSQSVVVYAHPLLLDIIQGAPKQPKKGPRWYAAAVVTYSANRWFDARGQRMHSRVLVWNVFKYEAATHPIHMLSSSASLTLSHVCTTTHSGNVTHLRMGASASAAYMSHVTHLNNYRNMVICSCQDGSIVAWVSDTKHKYMHTPTEPPFPPLVFFRRQTALVGKQPF